MDDAHETIRFAKKAIDVAMKKIEMIKDPDEKSETESILGMLRENVANWEQDLRRREEEGDVE